MSYQMGTVVQRLQINDFLLDCGKVNHPRDFSVQVLKKLDALIPYDQGRVYFLDDQGEIVDKFLLGVDPQIFEEYKKRYSTLDGGQYSVSRRIKKYSGLGSVEELAHDWTVEARDNEFFTKHLKPQGIRYSFGLPLYDMRNSLRCIIILDRVGRGKYGCAEMNIMATILPHLNNLYKNYFFDSSGSGANAGGTISSLTARENEIVLLLCKGAAPVLIGEQLFISLTTVYKHIAHIYEKLSVSSRQELLVKLYDGHFVRRNATPLSSATVPAKWPGG
ncbi:MAG: helix-turn-helix transcriptional regulator [Treponema sp.]|jgi:DNA-binding CsgD family transcriptional regulator|nr:helix-turn-helix transcriptional regulator [Treponema sp.]